MFGDSPFGPIGKTNLARPSSASINEQPYDTESPCLMQDPTAFVETYRSNVRVAGNIESYRLDTVVIRSFPASHLLRCSVL
jgi:hypothetical protein